MKTFSNLVFGYSIAHRVTGTDFRTFTCVEVMCAQDGQGVQCSFEEVCITAECPEDPVIAEVRTFTDVFFFSFFSFFVVLVRVDT